MSTYSRKFLVSLSFAVGTLVGIVNTNIFNIGRYSSFTIEPSSKIVKTSSSSSTSLSSLSSSTGGVQEDAHDSIRSDKTKDFDDVDVGKERNSPNHQPKNDDDGNQHGNDNDNKNHYNADHLLKPSPVPVVFLSSGRAGSASTIQILTKLAGYQEKFPEVPGSDEQMQKTFFKNLDPDDGGMWVIDELKRRQKRTPKATIVGIKWKPYGETFFENVHSKLGLEMIANSRHPDIKVIRNRRNLLDVLISKRKHTEHHEVGAHCKVGDKKCIERIVSASQGIEMPPDLLLKHLAKYSEQERLVDDLLDEMNISHVDVTYERLYYASNDDDVSEEWTKIFRFLGISLNGNKGITHDQIRQASAFSATNVPWHNASLSNYEEIRGILHGTEFEHLLH